MMQFPVLDFSGDFKTRRFPKAIYDYFWTDGYSYYRSSTYQDVLEAFKEKIVTSSSDIKAQAINKLQHPELSELKSYLEKDLLDFYSGKHVYPYGKLSINDIILKSFCHMGKLSLKDNNFSFIKPLIGSEEISKNRVREDSLESYLMLRKSNMVPAVDNLYDIVQPSGFSQSKTGLNKMIGLFEESKDERVLGDIIALYQKLKAKDKTTGINTDNLLEIIRNSGLSESEKKSFYDNAYQKQTLFHIKSGVFILSLDAEKINSVRNDFLKSKGENGYHFIIEIHDEFSQFKGHAFFQSFQSKTLDLEMLHMGKKTMVESKARAYILKDFIISYSSAEDKSIKEEFFTQLIEQLLRVHREDYKKKIEDFCLYHKLKTEVAQKPQLKSKKI